MALPYRWQLRVDQIKNSARGLFGGGPPEQPRPKMCPACGTLVGTTATRCHECGTSVNYSMAAVTKRFGGLFGERAPVTSALLVGNIFLFGVTLVAMMQSGKAGGLSILWNMDGEALYRLGAVWSPAIAEGEWFRLVMAMFLHGGLIHIGFNMMVLMDIGPVVEEVYGSPRFLFIYVATGICGNLLSAFTPLRKNPVLAIGASGAILGLVGVMIAITTKRGGTSMKALRSRLLSWVATIFAFGLFSGVVDNWAHAGGFIAGFGLGKILQDREPANASEKRVAQALGWLAGLILVLSVVFMVLHYRDPLS